MPFNKLLCLLPLVLLVGGCHSPGPQAGRNPEKVLVLDIHPDSLYLDQATGVTYYKDQPFNGACLRLYANQAWQEETHYLHGRKQGLHRKWYPDGTLSFESHYQEGRLHGRVRSWWSEGHLRSESLYADGVSHGTQRQWYRSGALFKQLHLNHGKEEGLQQAWRENGTIYTNYEARNGRIFGLKRANLCYELDDEEIQATTTP